jgi:hypothetical protein
MSGRTGIARVKRTPTPNKPPPDNMLLDGEICIEQNDPMRIWVGVPTSLDPSGRRLLYDKSTLAPGGSLTTVVHDASMAGDGSPASPLSLNQATQTQRAGARVATPAEVAAVTPDDLHIVTPQGLRTQTGLNVTALQTTNKTIIPAINEILDAIAAVLGVLVFAGIYDPSTHEGRYNGHGGMPLGGPLPLPPSTAGNDNAFLICFKDGPGGGPNEPAEPLHMEDWLVSDGDSWVPIHLHRVSILARNVGVVPPVAGGSDVQLALENIWEVAQSSLQNLYFVSPTFTGDGLTPGTALDIGVIDAGTY